MDIVLSSAHGFPSPHMESSRDRMHSSSTGTVAVPYERRQKEGKHGPTSRDHFHEEFQTFLVSSDRILLSEGGYGGESAFLKRS